MQKQMAQPQSLQSNSVNPANLVELQVLTRIVEQLQTNNDMKGSIPYLAKIVQIVANQRLEKPSPTTKDKQHYYQQLNELSKVQADAYAQLAAAYFQTQQFISCEANLILSVKMWEKLLRHDPASIDTTKLRLKAAYKQLAEAYAAMGKLQLAQHMEAKLERLE
ncbi:hypothetical protein [Parasitella parasitica]|uniref:Uncharacterized protein n=1 Tax=Parasitella parasitica TaxID=35722 RepID=A0A0B7NH22_9FUNG|nr:hypothetical protein [Parasitella parasitica]